MAGRFAQAGSVSYANAPELHVSGVGNITVPMAQEVHYQLRHLCQQEAQSELPAGSITGQAWQLNASLLAATTSGHTVHVKVCITPHIYIFYTSLQVH